MDNEKSFIVMFVGQTLVNFAAAVIAVSVVGWFTGDESIGMVGLLSLGRQGLSYASLLQLFIYSLIAAGIRGLLCSNYAVRKIMLLWRMALMFILSLIAAVILSVVCRWFPIENGTAWVSFFISVAVCFVIGIFLMFIKTRLEDKKYGKLLSDYKARQKKEGSDKK